MGRAVAVSFEGENVRIVYASLKKKGIEVHDVLTLKDEQFDQFLINEKTKEFIVVCDFKNFFQEIIYIPTVKKKYIKKIIEAEIRKRAPDFNDYSFIYFLYGEKVIENKRVMEIYIFAVKNEELNNIINRFVSRGKVIKAIYPCALSVASLVQSIDEPFLCVMESDLNKILFLIKNGQIQFVRGTHSFEKGMNDIDIQNINMTVSYCRQTMRITPSFIMLIGSICNNYFTTASASIPMVCLTDIFIKPQISSRILDFIFPISAFFISKDSKINLLTKEYKNFHITRLFLQYSMILFLVLSLIGIYHAVITASNCINLQNKLTSMQMNPADIDGIISLYDKKKVEIDSYKPFITSLNNAMSTPDAQRFLFLLSKITTDFIRIDSISITISERNLKGELKGFVKTEGYANVQRYYQQFVDSIAGLDGFKIKVHNLELKERTFQIEVEYQ